MVSIYLSSAILFSFKKEGKFGTWYKMNPKDITLNKISHEEAGRVVKPKETSSRMVTATG